MRKAKTPVSAKSTQSLIAMMKYTLNGIKHISYENGNALSAPQSGIAIRLILLRIEGIFVPMINPEIISKSQETFLFEEESFSFYSLRAKVERIKQVTETYFDEHGQSQQRKLEYDLAGLVQHEIDHLDGIFILDRVTDNVNIQSIDYLLGDNPQRLATVREMIAYMADPKVCIQGHKTGLP